ncbi:hypothetical protein FBEOM_14526 [Fusarium beomiforme]|uniref:Ankyrin repeat protein n=1 Tax=Fusarium beomiforme TaxID=44412 RepID=A0A9P5A3D0_9HYPO|nr:hypothetical protein FBEOM_14526 [Fusarium beomiforme]
MTDLLASSGSSAKAVVGITKDFLRCYKNHALTKWSITVPGPVYPSKSFSISLNGELLYSPPCSTKLDISPLACAVIEGESAMISELLVGFKQSMPSNQFQDEFGATPIMYAMQLPAPHDWKIINLLIEEGADPCYRIYIDGVSWPYSDIAKAMGKPDLAKLLEEAILEMSEDEETDVPSRS